MNRTELMNQRDVDFIKSLKSNLCLGTKDCFILKRSLGRNMNSNISSYMSFLKILESENSEDYSNIKIYREDIYYLIACLYYNSERKSEGNKKYIKYETLLKRVFSKSASMERRVEDLLTTNYEKNGIFEKKFISLFNYCTGSLGNNESVDYLSLLKDLKNWNNENNYVRKKWARAIIMGIPGKENTGGDEEV